MPQQRLVVEPLSRFSLFVRVYQENQANLARKSLVNRLKLFWLPISFSYFRVA